jgi:putative transposase
MPYDPQRHHRRSIRLRGHDYTTPGAYYITICVDHGEHLLGEVVGGRVALGVAGQMAERAWRNLSRSFPCVTLDAFVVMPNHLHGIILLRGQAGPRAPRAGRPRGTTPGSIPAIVQSFKSVSARRINRARGTPGMRVWQEDYYEHIVRSDADLDRIRRYIVANPARWRQ